MKLKRWLKKVPSGITVFLMIGCLLSLLYGVAEAIGINRIVGSNVIPGWGIQTDNDSTEFNATQAWTDSLWEMVYDMIDTTVASGEALDSVTAWGNMINVHEDSITAWANLVNDNRDSILAFSPLVNEAKDSLTAWANLVNDDRDSVLAFSPLVNEAKDSLISWANKVNTSLQEYDQPWGGADLAIRTGVSAKIGVYFPLANDSNAYFVRHVHESTTDNEIDTIVFSGYLPIGMDATGVDSITYNIRTSMVADSSSIEVKVWKRDGDDLGALVACDVVAATATTAGAWEHQTTGAMTTPANAGDVIEVWFIVTFGSQVVGVLAEHDKPKVWYTGK